MIATDVALIEHLAFLAILLSVLAILAPAVRRVLTDAA